MCLIHLEHWLVQILHIFQYLHLLQMPSLRKTHVYGLVSCVGWLRPVTRIINLKRINHSNSRLIFSNRTVTSIFVIGKLESITNQGQPGFLSLDQVTCMTRGEVTRMCGLTQPLSCVHQWLFIYNI